MNPFAPVSLPLAKTMARALNLGQYIEVPEKKDLYFLLPFSLVSILGLYLAAIQKPNYYSEGKDPGGIPGASPPIS